MRFYPLEVQPSILRRKEVEKTGYQREREGRETGMTIAAYDRR